MKTYFGRDNIGQSSVLSRGRLKWAHFFSCCNTATDGLERVSTKLVCTWLIFFFFFSFKKFLLEILLFMSPTNAISHEMLGSEIFATQEILITTMNMWHYDGWKHFQKMLILRNINLAFPFRSTHIDVYLGWSKVS